MRQRARAYAECPSGSERLQQAGRCSDQTAFFYLGRLVEMDVTQKIFTKPANQQTEDYITGRFG